MSESTKRVTSKDIARLANVSQPTVSYVLNNTPGKSISDETRKKVLRIAKELNYTVNASARRLKTNKSYCVSLRLENTLSNERHTKMIDGARSYLEPRNYSLIISSDQKGSAQYPEYINACFNSLADGILFIPVGGVVPEDVVKIVKDHNIPFSVIGSTDENCPYSNVQYDYLQTTFHQADILIREGFRRIIYLRSTTDNKIEDLRERGVKAAVYSVPGIELEIRRLKTLQNSSNDLVRNAENNLMTPMDIGELRSILQEAGPDTAFVCCYSPLPQTVKKILYMDYIRNPSAETANWYRRSVSYRFDHYEAGLEATRSLMDQIRGISEQRTFSLVPIFDPISADESFMFLNR